jgi:hypothetical protein
LRWRRNPILFIERHLINPETGAPFKLLDAEKRFLRLALTLGPDGRLLYPEMVFGAIKKSGKSAFAAIHPWIGSGRLRALVEFCNHRPVRSVDKLKRSLGLF